MFLLFFQPVDQNQGYDYQQKEHSQAPVENNQNRPVHQLDLAATAPPDTTPAPVGHYKCDICQDTFNTRGEKERHVKSEHQGARHQCPDCKSRSREFSSLVKHVRFFHYRPGFIPSDLKTNGHNGDIILYKIFNGPAAIPSKTPDPNCQDLS